MIQCLLLYDVQNIQIFGWYVAWDFEQQEKKEINFVSDPMKPFTDYELKRSLYVQPVVKRLSKGQQSYHFFSDYGMRVHKKVNVEILLINIHTNGQ